MSGIPDSFVAFDLETTGFSSPGSRNIEIGALKVLNGRIAETWQRFVNSGCHIPRNITELTGITDAMVRNAFLVEVILPDFLDFVGDLPMAAHILLRALAMRRQDGDGAVSRTSGRRAAPC